MFVRYFCYVQEIFSWQWRGKHTDAASTISYPQRWIHINLHSIGVLTHLLSSIYHHTQNLYLMPIYARAPSTGPHTIVGSKVLLHGLAALMIGFFCL